MTPVASLFRVTLQFTGQGEKGPVSTLRIDRSLNVVGQDVEEAIARARENVRDVIGNGRRARVVSVELVEGIDVQ